MKIVSILLFPLGSILAIGYPHYCLRHGGELLGLFAVYDRDPDSGEEIWHTPLTLDLSPEMNPVELSVLLDYEHFPQLGRWVRSQYIAIIRKGGEEIWRKDFLVDSRIADAHPEDRPVSRKEAILLDIFTVEETGEFEFRFRRGGSDELYEREISLEVRGKATRPSGWIVGTGWALIVLSPVLFVLGRTYGRR